MQSLAFIHEVIILSLCLLKVSSLAAPRDAASRSFTQETAHDVIGRLITQRGHRRVSLSPTHPHAQTHTYTGKPDDG